MLDNAGIAELLIREAETATGHRERALQRAAHAAFMWPEEVRRCAANPDSGQVHKVLAKNPQWRARLR